MRIGILLPALATAVAEAHSRAVQKEPSHFSGATLTAAYAAMVVNRLNVVAHAKTPAVRMTCSALMGFSSNADYWAHFHRSFLGTGPGWDACWESSTPAHLHDAVRGVKNALRLLDRERGIEDFFMIRRGA
jgi:hypothetical protein